jgi:CspA family cold shock protein
LTDADLPQFRGQLLKWSKRMATGTVKWFNADKGYGFIAPDNGGSDVFVHITAVQQAGLDGLNENQKINYEVENGNNGRESATNLQAQ